MVGAMVPQLRERLKIAFNWRLTASVVIGLTLIGLAFATQLRWHYQVPWSVSVYWGLTDWYLWGLIGTAQLLAARSQWFRGFGSQTRLAVLVLLAPLLMILHVCMTVLVGALIDPSELALSEQVSTLFAKKLTMNLVVVLVLGVMAMWPVRLRVPESPSITGRRGSTRRVLTPAEIVVLEAVGNYVRLSCADGPWLVRSTLSGMAARLGPRFLRISRFCVVNTLHVRAVKDQRAQMQLELSDGRLVAVARRQRTTVRRELQIALTISRSATGRPAAPNCPESEPR